jgi:hypothetical protein
MLKQDPGYAVYNLATSMLIEVLGLCRNRTKVRCHLVNTAQEYIGNISSMLLRTHDESRNLVITEAQRTHLVNASCDPTETSDLAA